jgi:hypothetical protein
MVFLPIISRSFSEELDPPPMSGFPQADLICCGAVIAIP